MQHQTRPRGQRPALDLAGCPRALLTDADNLREWVAALVQAIGMRPYGEPVIEHFATHSYDAAGFTLVQLIETSNVCAHCAENLGQVYIDVFSCKPFSANDAVRVCRDFFHPEVVDCRELGRGRFDRVLAETA